MATIKGKERRRGHCLLEVIWFLGFFTIVTIDSIIGQLPSQHNLSQFSARFPEDSKQCQSAEHIWFNYRYLKLRSMHIRVHATNVLKAYP